MSKLGNIPKRIGEVFLKIFSKRTVNDCGRKTAFTRRRPKKLDGFAFLGALTLGRLKKCR
jgi:hypothetical protein